MWGMAGWTGSEDDGELLGRLRDLARKRPRYGYRRLHRLLRRERMLVNRKRIYRIYKAAGLKVRRRSRRKLRLIRASAAAAGLPPKPAMLDGLRARLPRRRSAHSHAQRHRRVHARVPRHRGRHVAPLAARRARARRAGVACRSRCASTTGPEFISNNFEAWASAHGVTLDYIQPNKPTQNGHVESFKGRFRKRVLAQSAFPRSRALARRSSCGALTNYTAVQNSK